jgi:hypothetical protein
MARWSRILVVIGVVGLLLAPASAALADTHVAGEQVDYPLVFPVGGGASAGTRSHYWDSRASGLHHAQDIMAPKMTPVYAVAAGTIQYVNWSRDPVNPNPDRCCSLVLAHDDGWVSSYIHLNNDTPGTDDGLGWGIAPGIAVGVHVAAGTQIGWVGDSGNAEDTAPHLHFELRDPDGVIVDAYRALLAAQGISPPPPVAPPSTTTTTTTTAATTTTTTTSAALRTVTPATSRSVPTAEPATAAAKPPSCPPGRAKAQATLPASLRALHLELSPTQGRLQSLLALGGLRPSLADTSPSTYQAVRSFQMAAGVRAAEAAQAAIEDAVAAALSHPGVSALVDVIGNMLGLEAEARVALKRTLLDAGFGTLPGNEVSGTVDPAAVEAFLDALLGADGTFIDAATRATLAQAVALAWPATCGG